MKFQVFFIAIFIACCVAFVGCDRVEPVLEPEPADEEPMVTQNVVSLEASSDISTVAVGEEIKIDLKIADGLDVAGYAALFAFDATALRYINTMEGGYLPSGGIWMSPERSDSGDYEVRLTVGETTTVGPSVSFLAAPDAPPLFEFVIEAVFFKVPEQHLPPELVSASSEYWTFSVLSKSPIGTDIETAPVGSHGTLATLTFEVIAAKPGLIRLLDPSLTDANDASLEATVQNDTIIVNASGAP